MTAAFHTAFRIASYGVLLAMLAAVGWAGWHSIYYWSGIGV